MSQTPLMERMIGPPLWWKANEARRMKHYLGSSRREKMNAFHILFANHLMAQNLIKQNLQLQFRIKYKFSIFEIYLFKYFKYPVFLQQCLLFLTESRASI
eukprot:GHVU01013582.1.p1 GENE.GHVU01013582.1~~GHVU01013582.1.p1  ORF type:complete len:100 (+),score=8.74 GHVU01013582.1:395-694(+)